jgi:hypothetical protein
MSISFFIKFPIEPFKIIKEDSKIALIGSCFTEHIGNRLNMAGLKTTINPFGILFNPLSISNSINRILNLEVYKKDDLTQNQEGRFVSFDHHGRFSGPDADKVVDEINTSLMGANAAIKAADILIVTLGSAWVYKHLSGNKIVANCHKIPNHEFEKELLDVQTIVSSLNETLKKIRNHNPDSKILFTISPVKHLRDGIIENQRSKATLILAISELLKSGDNDSYYFPAYEIVTDELRDYRFFEADHAHPNQMAIDYVWQRFIETCFTETAIEKAAEAEKLSKAFAHKTLHNEGMNENLEQKIKRYLDRYK